MGRVRDEPGPELVAGPGRARNLPNYQVFGIRPCPSAVVAGADTGRGRLPPSTLYTGVLALKGTLLLPACSPSAIS
ncbi:hypothetical protein MMARJ_26640 [Mycobacterium marseillense]|uniref:Uncharacterized protein n=1 Tax=Mycobacterium marseillense TaxID=701042 RepID=A0ABM7JE72_9MYCO|nr:hypothetical protein MMARJ_26640 [Mycobacterium marseillense]